MRAAFLSAGIVVVCASSSFAQTVEYRVVERTGQTVANALDNVLDFAVQARVNGSGSLGAFYFDMRILGEAESRGTLQRGGISNIDGTYDPAISTGSVVGRHGAARQYSYFGTVNQNFNGVINSSSGTFTNTPDQEIGLITGVVQGSPMLQTPGLDTNGDGHPDTWSGNGSGTTPTNGTTASLNPAAATAYFANNQFVDLYRFRYTLTDLSARTLQIRPLNAIAEQFTQFVFVSGQWGAQNTLTASAALQVTGIDISVVPAPGAAFLLGVGALATSRRRR